MRYAYLLFVVLSLFIGRKLFAQDNLNFTLVLEEAIKKSPALTQMQNRIASRKSEAKEMGIIPNPEISGEVRPYVSSSKGNDAEYEVAISQPLRLSYFGKRATVADLMSEAVSVEEKLAYNELHQGLLLLYGKIWTLQQKNTYLDLAVKRIKGIYARVHDNKQGLFPTSTVRLFEASLAKLSGQQLGAGADLARAKAALTKETGLQLKDKMFQPLILKSLSSIQSLEPEHLDIPTVRRVKLRSKIANEQYDLAKMDSMPKFAPKIGFEHVDSGTDRVNIGVTFDLPFYDRNQAGRIKSAGEKAEQDTLMQYANSAAFKEELNQILESAKLAEKECTLYSEKILPAITSSLEAAEKEFDSGQGNLFQIWQILSEMVEAQDRYLELWIKALSYRTEMNILYGEEV